MGIRTVLLLEIELMTIDPQRHFCVRIASQRIHKGSNFVFSNVDPQVVIPLGKHTLRSI